MHKLELKAMISAPTIFTVFVFGGSASYILGHLNIPSDTLSPTMSKYLPVAEDNECTPILEISYVSHMNAYFFTYHAYSNYEYIFNSLKL